MREEKNARVGVGIMILKNNKVLLGKRNVDPKKADSELRGEGTWTIPGGKLDYKEKLEDCVYREVKEETGIEVNREKLRLISATNDIKEDKHFVTVGFLCEDFKGDPKIMEPEEITEWRWFKLNRLPSPIFPPSEKIIKKFKEASLN